MVRVLYYSALSESHYAIMTEENLFVGRIEDGDVVLVEKVRDGVIANWLYPATALPAGLMVIEPRSPPKAVKALPMATVLAVPS